MNIANKQRAALTNWYIAMGGAGLAVKWLDIYDATNLALDKLDDIELKVQKRIRDGWEQPVSLLSRIAWRETQRSWAPVTKIVLAEDQTDYRIHYINKNGLKCVACSD